MSASPRPPRPAVQAGTLCQRCGIAPRSKHRRFYCSACAVITDREARRRRYRKHTKTARDLIKRCRGCSIEKPLREFPRGATLTNKHRCSECIAAERIRPKIRKKPSPPASPPRRWSKARLAEAAAALANGLDYRAVAAKMGVTRNQLIGAIYRAKEREPSPAPSFNPEALLIEGCRWIDGDPMDAKWHWCGQPTVTAVFNMGVTVKAWCSRHLGIVYQRKPRTVLNPSLQTR